MTSVPSALAGNVTGASRIVSSAVATGRSGSGSRSGIGGGSASAAPTTTGANTASEASAVITGTTTQNIAGTGVMSRPRVLMVFGWMAVPWYMVI